MSTRYSVTFFPCSDSSHRLRSPKGECPSLGRFFLCPGKSLHLGQGADMHRADTPVFSPDDDDSTLDSNSAQLLRPRCEHRLPARFRIGKYVPTDTPRAAARSAPDLSPRLRARPAQSRQCPTATGHTSNS